MNTDVSSAVNNGTNDAIDVAIIGFGEVGPIFAEGLIAKGCRVCIYDAKLDHEQTRAQIVARAEAVQARVAPSLAAALEGARLVFSAVTASQAGAVAAAAAQSMRAGQTFVDLNSVSPKVKQGNCTLIEASGAAYVESAVMAPVPPQGMKVLMLLGGKTAASIAQTLNGLGMRAEAVAQEVGVASAIKLCRSIMIKGMEALCVQSMLAAHHFGVDARVLASLAASFPGVGWDTGYEAYLIGRVVEHGQRRSEEMREAALMLSEIGIDPSLSTAVADVQQALAEQGKTISGAFDEKGRLPDWRHVLGSAKASEATQAA